MTEVRWTEQAADDLAAILEFIRRDSPAYAHLVRRSAELVEILTIFHSARLLPEGIRGDAG